MKMPRIETCRMNERVIYESNDCVFGSFTRAHVHILNIFLLQNLKIFATHIAPHS